VKLVEELVHHRNGVSILDCDGIEGVIVDAKALGTICLLDEEYQRRKGRGATPDQPLLEHGGALMF
jgi:hypothetical protein